MTFPKARGRGYNVDEVEDFLDEARRSYSGDDQNAQIDAARIRGVAFSMKRGGYSVEHVDSALDRLEDAFATQEREKRASRASTDQPDDVRLLAQEIVNRLARPRRHRFDRAGFMVDGYHRDDVDTFVNRISSHLVEGEPLDASEVRTVAFRPRRGGYREAQVDLLLDAVITVMLAVR